MNQVRVTEIQDMSAPPGRFTSVYVAAKLIHAAELVEMRQHWPTIYFTARWPLTANLPSEQSKPAALWTRDNRDDIARSDVVLVYADPHDHLTDVLWEVGIALAMGKDIYLVGPQEKFGKYGMISGIRRFSDRGAALTEISKRINYTNHADQLMGSLRAVHERLDSLQHNRQRRR
jgi:nucleoside 2-deoxyribosyltransferase